MKNSHSLFSVSCEPNVTNVLRSLPSRLYANEPVLPEPGLMSAVARSQTRRCEMGAVATCEPGSRKL